MANWRDTLLTLTNAGEHAILVTRSAVVTPDPDEDRLVVADQIVAGSVGDDLQDVALRIAQALLQAGSTGLIRHTLAGQTLIFEPVPPVRFQVAVFGASAVAKATIRLLADLPCRVDWFVDALIEGRDERPGNVTVRHAEDLTDGVKSVARGALLLIMTHDQSDDYPVVAAALRRRDLSCVLVVGTPGKRERFMADLAAEGLGPEADARLICPISATNGRRPAEIAIGAAARLLEASSLPVFLAARAA
jgi:xanthine dehydrogenase accessory factor